MDKKICIQSLKCNEAKTINYTIRKSNKAKRIGITVYNDGKVVLVVPWLFSRRRAEKFLKEKSDWVLKKIEASQRRPEGKILPSVKNSRADYLKNKKEVARLIKLRLEYFNRVYNFKYNRISIRNQKTRWGSCSDKGNLNFNYRMIYLSGEMFDYVVVHELCHLRQMNHSSKFWDLVAITIEDYLKIRKELKNVKFS